MQMLRHTQLRKLDPHAPWMHDALELSKHSEHRNLSHDLYASFHGEMSSIHFRSRIEEEGSRMQY
jgi:hypothetical protein